MNLASRQAVRPISRPASRRADVLRLLCLLAYAAVAAAQPAGGDRPPLDYFVIVTGNEILEGFYPDAHTHYITRTLRPLGGRCLGAIAVDDREADLIDAFRFALGKAPLVIVTGGLGPTPNDITRETLAEFTGIPLREHADVVAVLERRFTQPRDQLRPNLRRQALVPASGTYLPNGAGTAVGLVFDTTNATMVALPGPPRELQPMVERELVPLLQKRFGLRSLGSSLTLRFAGVGQSQISQTLQEHVKLPPDLVITSQFDAGRVDFTFTLPGQTEGEKGWLAALADTLRRELGASLYAEDGSSLEERTVRAFMRRGFKLALAEVGSGGHITGSLAQVQNLDQVLVGSYVAPTEGGLRQLLQLEIANASGAEPLAELARAVRLRSQSDVAVVVGYPEPEEGRPRNVRVLWVDPKPREAQFPWSDASAASNALLTTRILDWLRRQLAEDDPEG